MKKFIKQLVSRLMEELRETGANAHYVMSR